MSPLFYAYEYDIDQLHRKICRIIEADTKRPEYDRRIGFHELELIEEHLLPAMETLIDYYNTDPTDELDPNPIPSNEMHTAERNQHLAMHS